MVCSACPKDHSVLDARNTTRSKPTGFLEQRKHEAYFFTKAGRRVSLLVSFTVMLKIRRLSVRACGTYPSSYNSDSLCNLPTNELSVSLCKPHCTFYCVRRIMRDLCLQDIFSQRTYAIVVKPNCQRAACERLPRSNAPIPASPGSSNSRHTLCFTQPCANFPLLSRHL